MVCVKEVPLVVEVGAGQYGPRENNNWVGNGWQEDVRDDRPLKRRKFDSAVVPRQALSAPVSVTPRYDSVVITGATNSTNNAFVSTAISHAHIQHSQGHTASFIQYNSAVFDLYNDASLTIKANGADGPPTYHTPDPIHPASATVKTSNQAILEARLESGFCQGDFASRKENNTIDLTTSIENDVIDLTSPVKDDIIGLTSSIGSQDEFVCYGMINDMRYVRMFVDTQSHQKRAVQWNGTAYLQDIENRCDVLQLAHNTHRLLSTLNAEAQSFFEFWLCPSLQERDGVDGQSQPPSDHAPAGQCSLSAVVYGPLSMATDVGDWLNAVDTYLQMPTICSLDVKYKNPHCLSFDDDNSLTVSQLQLMSITQHSDGESTQHEDIDGLYTEDDWEEAEQPSDIRTSLHKHQKQALKFMLEREKGWNLDGPSAGVWKETTDHFGRMMYKNMLSGRLQKTRPTEFRGGLLADEMGLGKTCSMLSLVATDLASKSQSINDTKSCAGPDFGTLIVVPFALLQVWEKQIRYHFRPNAVKWKIFHGQNKTSTREDLAAFDIVVTTFNTVALEWQRRKCSKTATKSCSLFSRSWHRVILDEAHVIRNRSTLNARAVCALVSERRWCITGTPIQNRLSDLYGLLRFLGVEPYNHFKDFETDILRPWKSQNDQIALKRLLHLMRSVAIRRPRSIISLPEKHEIIQRVQLSPSERAAYEHAREGAFDVLTAAMTDRDNAASAYINALQKINDMRYVCNHGMRPSGRSSSLRRKLSAESNDWETSIHELDRLMAGSGLECSRCGTDLQEDMQSDQTLHVKAMPSLTAAGIVTLQLCQDCLQQQKPDHCSRESRSPSSTSSCVDADPTSPRSPISRSSKIQAVLDQLYQISTNDKCVVFSYWTSTLAAIASSLTEHGIEFVQYDGTLSRTQRELVLHTFANNPTVRVILVSITCGGQGLDLTAANHAFLVEPQWNPMLEEQAMSRVHRLGQVKPVRLVRFIVEGTWEEKIRGLQERKRNLVDLIVERKNLKDGEEGKKELWFLRELIA